MKWYFLFVSVFFILSSCSEAEKPKRPDVKIERKPLIMQDANGIYKEWYPGHEQVKVTGRKNKAGERVGIWKFYSERGVEISVSVYQNGLREGHTVVKHPNGALHYTGEYAKDEPIGVWKFYDEQGNLTQTKDYD